MNVWSFIARILLSAGLSCITSIGFSVALLAILASLVHFFELNYRSENYWVFNVSMIGLVISWIISFGCFMSIIK
jgi:hypothetical protein